jgi:hypothetical protein
MHLGAPISRRLRIRALRAPPDDYLTDAGGNSADRMIVTVDDRRQQLRIASPSTMFHELHH